MTQYIYIFTLDHLIDFLAKAQRDITYDGAPAFSLGENDFGKKISFPLAEGQTITQGFITALTDALYYDTTHIDDYAQQHPELKVSEIISRWEKYEDSYMKLFDSDALGLQFRGDFGSTRKDVLAYLMSHADEINEKVTHAIQEKEAAYQLSHPHIPETDWVRIEDLQDNLDLGEYGNLLTEYDSGDISDAFIEIADNNVDLYDADLLAWLPDNYEWLEHVQNEGLLSGTKNYDLFRHIQIAQMESIRDNLYEHSEDIIQNLILEDLKDKGIYVISDDLANYLYDHIDMDDTYQNIEDILAQAQENIINTINLDGDGICTIEDIFPKVPDVTIAFMTVKGTHEYNEHNGNIDFYAFLNPRKSLEYTNSKETISTPSLSEVSKDAREAASALAGNHDDQQNITQGR
ncbi:hypothetical protein [Faecalicoccus pleomorphus]|uniref:hypothetical protein n=1 Tax=Faecalicoccus pleomorphus TaxID=1323 RepID=UPI0022E358E7|nr:hypothetical protein [Faecalicoccus pleomorphus]